MAADEGEAAFEASAHARLQLVAFVVVRTFHLLGRSRLILIVAVAELFRRLVCIQCLS